jgi:archaetidylserine synthase
MNAFRVMKLPDCFTLLNIILGFYAILLASRADYQAAVVLILLAAAADGLDGSLARKAGSSPLGNHLDSLADLVSFGAAPAFLALTAFPVPWAASLAGAFYLSCGALRLARFNVSARSDQFFEGLPIPAAGIALSASVLLGWPELPPALMLLLGLLMVSSISYPKVRDLRILAIVGLASLLAALLIWLQGDIRGGSLLLTTIIMIYLASPVVISCLRKGK